MYDLTSLSNNFEVVLNNKNNQLVLKDLTNFIDDLKETKEKYTQNKINEVVLEKLKMVDQMQIQLKNYLMKVKMI